MLPAYLVRDQPLDYWLRWSFTNFFPGLIMNHDISVSVSQVAGIIVMTTAPGLSYFLNVYAGP
jgi:hypothetical protein